MNGTRDIVFKRCGCTGKHTRRQLAGHCPHLADPGHGRWYYAVQVTAVGGRKARYRRGGFATRDAAVAARRAILDAPADEAAAGAWTVTRWLRYWPAQAATGAVEGTDTPGNPDGGVPGPLVLTAPSADRPGRGHRPGTRAITYGRRPHRGRQLGPPRPDHPVADLSGERIKRRPVLGGLISEYERAV